MGYDAWKTRAPELESVEDPASEDLYDRAKARGLSAARALLDGDAEWARVDAIVAASLYHAAQRADGLCPEHVPQVCGCEIARGPVEPGDRDPFEAALSRAYPVEE